MLATIFLFSSTMFSNSSSFSLSLIDRSDISLSFSSCNLSHLALSSANEDVDSRLDASFVREIVSSLSKSDICFY